MAIWQAEDGVTFYYEIVGQDPQKPVLVLLPGLLGAINSQWRQFIHPLSASHRLLLLDWRGHGRSGPAGGRLIPEVMVGDLFGLLDHLAVDRVHIAGYSLGGYLGLMAALEQPRRVVTLQLHSTRVFWTADAVLRLRRQIDPDTLSEKAPTYATQLAQEHGGSRWRALARQTGDLVGYLSENGLTEGMLRRLKTPVLVSVGDRDEVISLPESAHLVRLLPEAGLLVLPHTHRPIATLGLVPLVAMMQAFHRPVP